MQTDAGEAGPPPPRAARPRPHLHVRRRARSPAFAKGLRGRRGTAGEAAAEPHPDSGRTALAGAGESHRITASTGEATRGGGGDPGRERGQTRPRAQERGVTASWPG